MLCLTLSQLQRYKKTCKEQRILENYRNSAKNFGSNHEDWLSKHLLIAKKQQKIWRELEKSVPLQLQYKYK
jgi:hypothetical protein